MKSELLAEEEAQIQRFCEAKHSKASELPFFAALPI